MKFGVFFIVLLILFDKSSVSAASSSSFTLSPARIVGGFFSNAVSALLKWVWSLKPTTKTAVSRRSMMRFESGYTVETVFDGSKLGIEPYAVEIAPTGDLLVLDSVNSNIYRIPPSLSRYTRPKLVAGSAEGYTGHVDGKSRDARMNRPKALTVDDRGNIYVADTMNMVIRKISDTGVTTIAGGKWNRGGHSDGPSEDAKFSDDFEVVYVGSSCSLLVVDRGNQAIREIQLNFDDCAYQYGSSFPLVAVLIGAAFFGYILALLQRRLMAYSDNEDELQQQLMAPMVKTNFQPSIPPPPYQKPPKSTVRPPLIPSEDGPEKQEEEEGLFGSVGKLFTGAGSFVSDLFGASRKKPNNNQQQQQQTNQPQYLQRQQQQQQWPLQDSYVIPNDEPPPPLEARTPTPRKAYAFMSKDAEKIHQLRHGSSYFNSWEGDLTQQQQMKQQMKQQIQQQQMKQQIQQQQMKQQHLQQQRHYSLGPQTYYEQSCESTNEIVFGAVQESDKMRASMEIKAVNYGNSLYDNGSQHSFLRPRIGHGGGGSSYNNRHPY